MGGLQLRQRLRLDLEVPVYGSAVNRSLRSVTLGIGGRAVVPSSVPVIFARRRFFVAMANVQVPFQRPRWLRREYLEQGEMSLRCDPAGRLVVDLVDQLQMDQSSRSVLLECPAAQFVERSGGNVAATGV
jgi:hypothetical protein